MSHYETFVLECEKRENEPNWIKWAHAIVWVTDFYESCHVHSCNHQVLWAFFHRNVFTFYSIGNIASSYLHNEQMQWLPGNFWASDFFLFTCSTASIMYNHRISDFATWNLIFMKKTNCSRKNTDWLHHGSFFIIIWVQEAHFGSFGSFFLFFLVFLSNDMGSLNFIQYMWNSHSAYETFNIFFSFHCKQQRRKKNCTKIHWFGVCLHPFHWKGANEMLTHKSSAMKMGEDDTKRDRVMHTDVKIEF